MVRKSILASIGLLTTMSSAFAASDDAATGSVIVLLILMIGGYFFPSIIAFMRGHHQIVPIFLTNLFFGWTGLGWIGALIWSASAITYKRLT